MLYPTVNSESYDGMEHCFLHSGGKLDEMIVKKVNIIQLTSQVVSLSTVLFLTSL